jgi:predicted AAA+ superfamily ATPase
MSTIYQRRSRQSVLDALDDTRVVFVMGARQVGKSTLTGDIAQAERPATGLSLDNKGARDAAIADPDGFVAGLERPVLLDEVQRGGTDLLIAIKEAVDTDQSPGQFLLTGSANVLTNRKVNDALTGRIEIITLWPLSQSEIEGTKGNIVDALFTATPPQIIGAVKGRDAFVSRVAAGGYPEALRRSGQRRDRWFQAYLTTTLDRDLRDISDAHKLDRMPRLLGLLASRAANLLNSSEVSSRLGIEHKTVRSYTRLLETVFLVKTIQAWQPSIGSRESSTPKVYLVDSGVLAHLLGAGERRLTDDDQLAGKILENFVTMEVMKHLEWAVADAKLYHYRRQDDEVDAVLENRAGELACIEVKSAATIRERDWRALAKIRDARSAQFKAGFVIYTGEQTVPLGDRLWAVPVSGLWA